MMKNFKPTNENAFGVAMLAGRVVGTVTGSDGHITVRAMAKRKNDGGNWINCPFEDASHVFFAVPSAEGDFADKIGTLYPAHSGERWAGHWFVDRAQTDDRRVKAALYLMDAITGANAATHILKSERCARCSKELTHPDSIFAMFGPECIKKVGAYMPNASGTPEGAHQTKAKSSAHYDAMQEAGAREDWEAVERHAAAQTDAEIEKLDSLETVAGVPECASCGGSGVVQPKPEKHHDPHACEDCAPAREFVPPKPAAIVEQIDDKLTIVLRKGDDPQMVLQALDA